ncbi:MAG: dTDP-4-dehydrorhamnose reductase [Bdellovibrionales bacterium]|nr:dTDP-4-dehydrorhamnose reductase [Bdellovibrionales bacterium]
MKILLFGGSGQLGREVLKRAADLNFEVASPVVSQVDIASREQVFFVTKKVAPDLILNSAAFTDVDGAENQPEEAARINADGAGIVAEAAARHKCRLIHISTDFVFDGRSQNPLTETHPTNPLSVYGQTKLAGELAVMEAHPQALIVRTSSLHGAYGHNFVHIMLKLLKEKDQIKVVNDRWMSATWAGWLAEVVLDLGRMSHNGIVHASCAGALTWFDFTQKIKDLVSQELPHAARVELLPVPSSEFKQAAARPSYSVFDCSKLASLIGRKPITWEKGLIAHLRDLELLED